MKKGNKIKKLFGLLIILLIFGCSSQTSYKYLAVFFEGVPDPNHKDIAKTDSIKSTDSLKLKDVPITSQKSKYIYHPPYKERACESCHNSTYRSKLVETQPALCYICHEDFTSKFASLHGPVSGGFCTACHSPHFSENEKLLVKTGQSLCVQCHSLVQVKKNEVHADLGDMSCTECHNPHGGTDKFMLK